MVNEIINSIIFSLVFIEVLSYTTYNYIIPSFYPYIKTNYKQFKSLYYYDIINIYNIIVCSIAMTSNTDSEVIKFNNFFDYERFRWFSYKIFFKKLFSKIHSNNKLNHTSKYEKYL